MTKTHIADPDSFAKGTCNQARLQLEQELVEKALKVSTLILSALRYDFSNYTADRFAKWWKRRRGEKIFFIPFGFSAAKIDIFGFWVTDGKHHYICYEADTLPVHQDFIKTHELMHIVARHKTLNIGERSIYEFILQLADNSTVLLPQMRSFRSTQDDIIAEIMTWLVYDWKKQQPSENDPYLKSMDFI